MIGKYLTLADVLGINQDSNPFGGCCGIRDSGALEAAALSSKAWGRSRLMAVTTERRTKTQS